MYLVEENKSRALNWEGEMGWQKWELAERWAPCIVINIIRGYSNIEENF